MIEESEEPKKKYDKYDESIKIVFLGEIFTGKTSLINVYIKNEFNENISPTKTACFSNKIIKVGNKIYRLDLWDTAGQEKFRSMNKLFIKDSNIVLFTYDITRKSTLKELLWWVEYTKTWIGEQSAIFGVIGNKLDLFDKEKEIKEKDEEAEFELVNSEEGKKFAEDIDAEFLETSAKEGAPELEDFIYKLVEECIEKPGLGPKSEFVSLRGDESKSTKNCC
jgi:small GTP-binding protein